MLELPQSCRICLRLNAKRFSGENAPVVTPNMTIPLIVQRDPDQGAPVDEAIPFGLAVTISMPGEVALYDEVHARAAPHIRAPAVPGV